MWQTIEKNSQTSKKLDKLVEKRQNLVKQKSQKFTN